MAPRVTEEDLREDLENKRRLIERLEESALQYGSVVWAGEADLRDSEGRARRARRIVMQTGANFVEASGEDLDVQAGETLALAPTGQVVRKGLFSPLGAVVSVTRLFELNGQRMAEVLGHDGPKVVLAGRADLAIEEGCRVALNSTGCLVLAKLSDAAAEYERGESGVSWDDIGGLERVKAEMIEAIENPHKYPQLYQAYGQRPPKGISLEGEPGCGKTMLGKAVATSIARIHGADVEKGLGTGFIYLKGPEVLSKWVGEAEKSVREIFARARRHKERHGYPAIVFLDEAESLLLKRGAGVSSDVNTTIVPTFLSEMDGLDDSAAIVLLATNRVDRIDPAVLRDGRVDKKVHVPRPTASEFADVVRINLRKRPLARGASLEELADAAAVEVFRDDRIISEHTKGKQVAYVKLRHLVSGAMAANLVSLAVTRAMRRDIESGAKRPSGVGVADVVAAAEELQEMNRNIDHDAALQAALREDGARTREQPARAAVAAA